MAQEVLDVFLHDKLAGHLLKERGKLTFMYDESYLRDNLPAPLSVTLPIRSEPFEHNVAASFFSGLLPEGSVREILAKHLRISEGNAFALLKEIGGECAGAVSVYPQGESPIQINDSYRVLEDQEAYEILSRLNDKPFVGKDVRISGAGAQNKLIVAFHKGKIAIPLRNTPSTHIIKPEITNRGSDVHHTVHNELFCMRLAGKVGLTVPETFILKMNAEPFYVIKRYDRIEKEDGGFLRLHQEDFCQALQYPPENKYQNDGGPDLAMCFELLEEHIKRGVMAGANRLRLLQAVIFNFLIGNGDAHSKNFSLLYEDESVSLAPCYDLMCTSVYQNFHKEKMAMKIGGKYKFKEITITQFEKLGDDIDMKSSFVLAQAEKMAAVIMKASPKLAEELNSEEDTKSPIYGEIIEVIKRNVQQLGFKG